MTGSFQYATPWRQTLFKTLTLGSISQLVLAVMISIIAIFNTPQLFARLFETIFIGEIRTILSFSCSTIFKILSQSRDIWYLHSDLLFSMLKHRRTLSDKFSDWCRWWDLVFWLRLEDSCEFQNPDDFYYVVGLSLKWTFVWEYCCWSNVIRLTIFEAKF